jgi:UDP-N-acetylglucosamine 4-epimerase
MNWVILGIWSSGSQLNSGKAAIAFLLIRKAKMCCSILIKLLWIIYYIKCLEALNKLNCDITFPTNTKFLVTGAAGFIGANLVEVLLDLGYYVRGLDNFSTGKRENIEPFLCNPLFELIEGDIRDFSTCMVICRSIDYVLHQAAWGSVPKSFEEPILYEEINIKGTLNMMEAARLNAVKKFVYASSSSVYGGEPIIPKKEGREGDLLSPYALTKKVNEEYGRLYTRIYGLKTYGLRYFNVFGRRQDPNGAYAAVIPRFIKQLLSNERPTIYGSGEQSRDFTYIEDVIEANLKACKASNKIAGQVFNIACGEGNRIIDVYYKLCELLDKKIEPIYMPKRKGDIMHSRADISKAKGLLGYYPKWNFEKGIRVTIEWYKKILR